jgi:E3 ubiquitin-protein ligase CCNP1IP1
MTLDQESLQRKNDELVLALKEKNKKLLRTQELYDKLKRKAMLGQIQDAASDMVSSNIEAAQATGATLAEQIGAPGLYERQEHLGTPRRDAGILERERHSVQFAGSGMTQGHHNVHGAGGWQQAMGPSQSEWTKNLSVPRSGSAQLTCCHLKCQ